MDFVAAMMAIATVLLMLSLYLTQVSGTFKQAIIAFVCVFVFRIHDFSSWELSMNVVTL